MKGNILILSEPFGGGHTKVAEALKTSLLDWKCEICELGNYLQPRLTPYLAKGYIKTVQKAPWIWGKIYSSTVCESSVIPYLYNKIYFSKLVALLLQKQPDIIVATHPLPALAISSLRRYTISIPLIGIATDFHIHPSWSLTDLDFLCTPNQDFPHWLKTNTRLLATGIPVRSAFYTKKVKKVKGRVILWMGGSEGIYRKMNWIRQIEDDPSLKWIFVTGNNNKLYNYLKNAIGHLNHVKVLGYCDDIASLMDDADLLITKAGGVTCSEAVQKELPMLLVNSLSGQEKENTVFLVRNGLAETVMDDDVWKKIKELINDRFKLEQIKKNQSRYRHSINPDLLPGILENPIFKDLVGRRNHLH